MGQTVRPIIASGTIAAGELRISSVNGTAFIDLASDATASANFVAAVTHNDVIEISDSSKRKIIAYAKAQGTGETYTDIINGATLNGNMETGSPPTGWNVYYGSTVSSVADERTGGSGSKSLNIIRGTDHLAVYPIALTSPAFKLYKIDSWRKNIDLSTGVKLSIANSAGTGYTGTYTAATSWTNVVDYHTSSQTTNSLSVVLNGAAGKQCNIDDVILQQVLTPSNLGITLTNSPGGTTYNLGVRDANFNYNDTSGYTYRILSSTAYSKLIATQSPVSGTLHVATVDGGAMFYHDSIDFSSYAGNDTDSTKYLFVFYDSTGKSAQAYAGAVGGGEAYTDIIGGTDPNLLNGDMATGDPPTGWTPTRGAIASETGAGNYQTSPSVKLTTTAGQATSNVSRAIAGNYSGKLLKYSAYLKRGNADSIETKVQGSTSSLNFIRVYDLTPATITQYSQYGTVPVTDTTSLYVYPVFVNGDGKYAYADDVTLQQVTDVPATGLHLISSKNGSTRNMKSVESGFNANAITRLNIYRAL